MEEQEFQHDGQENTSQRTTKGFNKALAILFVLAIYLVIFLKILLIE